MKKIVSRLFLTLVFTGMLAAGLYFFGASTYPEPQSPEKRLYSSPPIPDSLSFAGEPVPLEYFDVRESLDRTAREHYFHSRRCVTLSLSRAISKSLNRSLPGTPSLPILSTLPWLRAGSITGWSRLRALSGYGSLWKVRLKTMALK